MSTVGCKTRDELLDVGKRSARDLMTFALNFQEQIGDDALLALRACCSQVCGRS